MKHPNRRLRAATKITAVLTAAILCISIVGAQEPTNWGLGFGAPGVPPTGNRSPEELAPLDAFFLSDTTQKKICLTFDCGYENGNTAAILDTLKANNISACFFVVGHFCEANPDLLKRMRAEGHLIGNHTFHHPDMSKISDPTAFAAELNSLSDLVKEITGKPCDPYYRAPRGVFNEQNLKNAQSLGYKSVFWSLAYVDWLTDKQPSHEEAVKKMVGRIHPGAVVLLHNTSKTNAEVLPKLIELWKAEGYTFGNLTEIK